MAAPFNSRIITGLSQFPENVPKELVGSFMSVYSAIHNLERLLSIYAGVDPEPEDVWGQLTPDDSLFAGNLNRWYVKANENLIFGQVVSPIVSGGELQVRLANATNNTRWACGIVTAPTDAAGVLAGEFCEVMVGSALITGISGLVAGTRYWLNTVNGQVAAAAAVAAGNIEQYVGWALSSTRLLMSINGNYIQH